MRAPPRLAIQYRKARSDDPAPTSSFFRVRRLIDGMHVTNDGPSHTALTVNILKDNANLFVLGKFSDVNTKRQKSFP